VPTGVPIRDIRDQLFDAAERVLVRDGISALTSRAVTTEAGVAKGILYRHFSDFDAFLAAFVLTRIERLDARSTDLRACAGTGTVADNLVDALAMTLDSSAIRIVTLIGSRHELLVRLRLTTPTGIPLLAETTKMISAYLTAERGLGRIPLEADVDSLAVSLVGGAHLTVAGREGAPSDPGDLRRVMTTVLDSVIQEQPRRAAQT
jgi:AcrR family transcriptional regulator